MNKINIILVFMLGTLIFVGCASTDLKVNVLGEDKSDSYIQSSSIYDMPKDASRVILAISSQILNTGKKSKDIEFDTSYITKSSNTRFFSFENAILLSHEDGLNFGSKYLKADVFFKDSLGRSLIYNIYASYSTGTKKIVVHSFTVEDKFEELQNSVCFIMPATAYNGLGKNGILNSFYSFYKYVALNAVTPKETRKYNGKKEWAVVTFTLERISESSILKIGASDKKNQYSPVYTDSTKYIDYNGWKVGIFIANFHLLDPAQKLSLYSKVVFTPGNESKKNIFLRRPSVVGAYKIM